MKRHLLLLVLVLAASRRAGAVSGPYFAVGNTSFYCMPAWTAATSWPTANGPISYIRPTADTCLGGATLSVASSDFGATFSASNLAGVSLPGVALIRGSSCLFDTWAAYQADVTARVKSAFAAGATAVLFADALAGKPPDFFTSFPAVTIPVCVTLPSDWPALSGLFAGAKRTVMADMTTMGRAVWSPAVEAAAVGATTNLYTAVGVSGITDYVLFVIAAHFNPTAVAAAPPPAPVATIAVDKSCSPSTVLYGACAPCWAMGASALGVATGSPPLASAVAFVPAPVPCFPAYHTWALMLGAGGASAVLYGESAQAAASTAPAAVAAASPSPLYVLLPSDGAALAGVLASPADFGVITPTVTLPAITAQGPSPYYAAVIQGLGTVTIAYYTAVGVGRGGNLGSCPAGQAAYNPMTWAGEPAAAAAPLNASVDCQLESRCAYCRVATAVVGSARGGVAILQVTQFTCLDAFQQVTRAAVAAGASAVVFVQSDDAPPASAQMLSLANTPRESIPSFGVTATCGAALMAAAASPAGLVMALPTLSGGIAVGTQTTTGAATSPPPPNSGVSVVASPDVSSSYSSTAGGAGSQAFLVTLVGLSCGTTALVFLTCCCCAAIRRRQKIREEAAAAARAAARGGVLGGDTGDGGWVIGIPVVGRPDVWPSQPNGRGAAQPAPVVPPNDPVATGAAVGRPARQWDGGVMGGTEAEAVEAYAAYGYPLRAAGGGRGGEGARAGGRRDMTVSVSVTRAEVRAVDSGAYGAPASPAGPVLPRVGVTPGEEEPGEAVAVRPASGTPRPSSRPPELWAARAAGDDLLPRVSD